MKLQVCWRQMGFVQLAMSGGKEKRFMYLLSRSHLVCFGSLSRAPVTFRGC